MDDSYAIAQPLNEYYENLYRELNPHNAPAVPAAEAAAFLKRSNLPMQALGQIWELSDTRKIGALDKRGAFVAFKLVAAAQQGKLLTSTGLLYDSSLAPPNFGGSADVAAVPTTHAPPPPVPPPPTGYQHANPATSSLMHSPASTTGHPSPVHPASAAQWAIGQADQVKYDSIFESLNPVNGKLSGAAVRPVLLNSGLDGMSLARIWELADQDKDGHLDRVEMSVALHLVYRSLQNEPLPTELPPSLIHPSKAVFSRRMSGAAPPPSYPPRPSFGSRAGSVTSLDEVHMSGSYSATMPKMSGARAASVQPMHYGAMQEDVQNGQNGRASGSSTPMGSVHREVGALTGSASLQSLGSDWPINSADYASQFAQCDTNHDGLVNGSDARGPLLSTGLSPQLLAHIWTLADIKKNGQLNHEQFALIMYLVDAARRGEPTPAELPPNLVPPSFRQPISQPIQVEQNHSVMTPQLPEATSMELKEAIEGENEEMKQLAESIQSMITEKRKTEENVAQLEADMTIKNSRIKNLQVELSTLESTVKQLERQKAEANRRLTDFDTQIEQLESACKAQREKKLETATRIEQIQQDEKAGEESKKKDLDEMETLRSEIGLLEQQLGGLKSQVHAELQDRERIVSEQSALETKEARDVLQEQRVREATEKTEKANEGLAKAVETEKIDEWLKANPGGLVATIDHSLLSDETTYAEASTSSAFGNNSGVVQPPDPFANTSAFNQPNDPFAQADPFAAGPGGAGSFAAAFPSDPFAGGFPADAFAPSSGDASLGAVQQQKAPPPRPAPPKSARQTPVQDPFGAPAPAANTGADFANFADFGAAFN